jgi:uncharacterized small protein (DUF1192 family)
MSQEQENRYLFKIEELEKKIKKLEEEISFLKEERNIRLRNQNYS